jgi:PilZ domain
VAIATIRRTRQRAAVARLTYASARLAAASSSTYRPKLRQLERVKGSGQDLHAFGAWCWRRDLEIHVFHTLADEPLWRYMHPSLQVAGTQPAPERRVAPRHKIAIQVEIRTEGGQAPIRVSTSDLSLSGCYVEMMFTLEVDRKLEMTLWLRDAKIRTKARVATCHPQFGNGIQFVNMKPEDVDLLSVFIDAESKDSGS